MEGEGGRGGGGEGGGWIQREEWKEEGKEREDATGRMVK